MDVSLPNLWNCFFFSNTHSATFHTSLGKTNIYVKGWLLAQGLSCQPLPLSHQDSVDSLYSNASVAPIGNQWWSLAL